MRAELIASRTALINQLRGLLTEFGVVMPKGRFQVRSHIVDALDHPDLPPLARTVLSELYERISAIDHDILVQDRRIKAIARDSDPIQRIMAICGIGALSATAIVANVGNAKRFNNGRPFCAWLGLVLDSFPRATSPA